MANLLDETRAKTAQAYDFAQPQRLSEKQKEALVEALQPQAKRAQDSLTEALGLECKVSIKDVLEVSSTALGAAPLSPAFGFQPAVESGQILCTPDAEFAQLLVERFLGGSGEFRTVERESTDIEIALLVPALKGMQSVWRAEGSESIEKPVWFVTGAELAKQAEVRGISVEYSVQFGEESRVLRVFATYEDITQVTKVAIGSGDESVENDEVITTQHLSDTFFKVRALVPPVPIRLRDLRELQLGDVVQLDRKVTDEVQVAIGDKVVFVGHPGTSDGKVGIRISRTVGQLNTRS